jgi:DNA helicase II / ATP-dependent DNA helicase PcrA
MQTPLDVAISELTLAQEAAANWTNGSLFVLAGPGSGKTRVLTTRIAKLLAGSPDKSFRVLALTFTNKAAEEMTTRISSLVPEQEHRASIGTFHSFCMQMLQQHGSHIGINPDFAIYSLDIDRKDLLLDAIKEDDILNSDDERFLKIIDNLKSRLIPPEGCAQRFKDPVTGQRIEKTYLAYEKALMKSNSLDFGSLIIQAYRLINAFPSIAARYRKTYAYWMFDEFQDTTPGQYKLIQALAGDEFDNIFAVADDDQIIYQWNGASYLQIQKFRADFQPEEIQLPTNYRCPPAIVAAANKLVVHNSQRTESKLPLEVGKTELRYPGHEHINVLRYKSDEEEAKGIAQSILNADQSILGEIAVLARTRASLEKIHQALSEVNVTAVIAQRRDEFRSAQFQWLSSTLRQGARPLDRRALQALIGSFNRWFGIELELEDIIAQAEVSSKSYLDEWKTAILQLTDNSLAIEFANLAADFGKQPSQSKKFIEEVFSRLPAIEEDTSDLAEDKAAWSELIRNIAKQIGKNAPLEQFLQELALRSKEPPVKADSVTLMTIHGAKGKEYDHVYVVGLAEEVLPSYQSIKAGENSVEMEEERRNCFVAITRAKEWLCLSYADSYRGWSKKPSRFLKEMDLELPIDAQ